MKDNLKIESIKSTNKAVLLLDGRIDAYWSLVLDEAIKEEIRSGNYLVSLDFSKVDYISSAGIRILVKYYKELKAIDGNFSLINLTQAIKSVIELVGMDMLIGKTATTEHGISIKHDEEVKFDDTVYILKKLVVEDSCTIELCGNPESFYKNPKDAGLIKKQLNRAEFGLGMGAISPDPEDAKQRMGEFIALGEAVAYLPTDSSNAPDYSLKSGKLIPEIQVLYGLFFNDAFDRLLHFDHHNPHHTIPFSGMIDHISKITGYTTFTLVAVAETAGLVGVSISKSPLEHNPEKIFSYPEVKENVHFTVEAEHARQLAVITGVFTFGKNKTLQPFCRPLGKNSEISGHAHAAVFSFHQLKKADVNLAETIRNCFENERLIDVMHLLNDDREAIGIGESRLINGTCWVGKVE